MVDMSESERSSGGEPSECASCGEEKDRLGFSEAREEHVCSECVAFLGEHGHYPDEDGPEKSVTVEYEVAP